MAGLGNTSASSLISAGASTAAKIQQYNDELQAYQWNSSAQTESDWQVYSNYLQGRIGNLNSTGNLSSASKALTLTSSLQSANRSYTSNTIQRESIGILEGTSSATDKQSAIVQMYQQAVANGDENLAQNLQQQYDTLNQQIQYDQQQAAVSYGNTVKANNIAQEQGYTDAADALSGALRELQNGFSEGGQKETTGKLASLTDSITQALGAEGIELPKGSQVSNGSVIKAALQGMVQLYGAAADIANVTEGQSDKLSQYKNDMQNLVDGKGINFGGQTFTLQGGNGTIGVDEYIANPKMLYESTTGYNSDGTPIVGLAKSAISGYALDKNGDIQPLYTGNGQTNYSIAQKDDQTKMKADLQRAGFNVTTDNGGNLIVKETTDGKNAFFQSATKDYNLSPTASYRVIPTKDGYQLLTTDNNDKKVLLNLSKDNNNNFGLYNQTAKGNQLISSFDKFNPLDNQLENSTGALKNYLANAAKTGQATSSPAFLNTVAGQFFNGNTKMAASALSGYTKQLNTVANNPVLQSPGVIPGVPLNTLPTMAAKQQEAATPKIPTIKTTDKVGPSLVLGMNLDQQVQKNKKTSDLKAAPVKAAPVANPAAKPAVGPQLSMGILNKSTPTKQATATMVQKNGGFYFYGANGAPINAAQYSQATGTGYRALLSQLASKGDKNSQVALNYVGNDYKFYQAPKALQGSLSALGASGKYI
jgi:hypothetical protein